MRNDYRALLRFPLMANSRHFRRKLNSTLIPSDLNIGHVSDVSGS
jgi:hypothetical protein